MHTKQQTVINNNTAEGPLIQNAILQEISHARIREGFAVH